MLSNLSQAQNHPIQLLTAYLQTFSPSTFFTKSSIFSQSEKFTLSNIFPHYHIPPQTPSKSILPSESKILTVDPLVDDVNSEYKCSVNIYIIYAQIVIIFF